MSRRERIQQLEDELRGRGADFMVDDGFDEEMTESFLQQVLACETAEHKPLREFLTESGYDAAKGLSGLLEHLALLGITVEMTDHLSDDERRGRRPDVAHLLRDGRRSRAMERAVPGRQPAAEKSTRNSNEFFLSRFARKETRRERWRKMKGTAIVRFGDGTILQAATSGNSILLFAIASAKSMGSSASWTNRARITSIQRSTSSASTFRCESHKNFARSPNSRPSRPAQPLLFPPAEETMADEKKVTETKTERKNDFFGNPKEEKTTTTEKKEGAFGDRKETTTTVERKEE